MCNFWMPIYTLFGVHIHEVRQPIGAEICGQGSVLLPNHHLTGALRGFKSLFILGLVALSRRYLLYLGK